MTVGGNLGGEVGIFAVHLLEHPVVVVAGGRGGGVVPGGHPWSPLFFVVVVDGFVGDIGMRI
jgi:hypothetical protein